MHRIAKKKTSSVVHFISSPVFSNKIKQFTTMFSMLSKIILAAYILIIINKQNYDTLTAASAPKPISILWGRRSKVLSDKSSMVS